MVHDIKILLHDYDSRLYDNRSISKEDAAY